jgi:16S rRNA (guanine527-N7)-methyltransferase
VNPTAGQIESALLAAGLNALPAGASERLLTYLELLLRWNARLNLTAIRTPEEIVLRHFVECSFAAKHLPAGIGTLLDFGSGAGFPGIPIAICRPEIKVTLAESQAKKAAFLAEAVRVLEITSEVYAGRVEAMPTTRSFDTVALRAVDKMAEAVSLAIPRARVAMAIFTTAGDAQLYRELAAEFSWREPIPLPNARETVLMIGER